MTLRINIERKTLENNKYRKVVYTTETMQLVLMSLAPGDDVPYETHNATQFIRVESGKARINAYENVHYLNDGDAVVIPPGVHHRVSSIGDTDLKLYTLYSPPVH